MMNRKSKKNWLVAAIMLGSLLAVIWAIYARLSEPLYQGHPVRYWVRRYSSQGNPLMRTITAPSPTMVLIGTNLVQVWGSNYVAVIPTATGSLLRIIPPGSIPGLGGSGRIGFVGSNVTTLIANPNPLSALAVVPTPGPALDQFVKAGRADVRFLIKAMNARETVYDRVTRLAWIKLRPHLPAVLANKLPPPNMERLGVRLMALSALGRLGPPASNAVPSLIAALEDSERGIVGAAALALRGIGPAAQSADLPLIQTLKHKDKLARDAALSALRVIGRGDPAVPPALEKVLGSLSSDIRLEAAELHWQIEGRKDAVIPALIEALQEMDPQYFWRAAQILGEMMPEAQAAIPTLVRALRHRENRIRGHAAAALGRMGPLAKGAAPALTEALQDDTLYVREAAAKALRTIASNETRSP